MGNFIRLLQDTVTDFLSTKKEKEKENPPTRSLLKLSLPKIKLYYGMYKSICTTLVMNNYEFS
jgi:hypothetical protein